MPTESNQPNQHPLFSGTTPAPPSVTPLPSAQQAAKPHGIFGAAEPSCPEPPQQFAPPQFPPQTSAPGNAPRMPQSSPVYTPTSPNRSSSWMTYQNRLGIGIGSSLAVVILLIAMFSHAKPGPPPPLPPPPPPVLSPQAKTQMQSALQPLKTNYDWLAKRYLPSAKDEELNPVDISGHILPSLNSIDTTACPKDFKEAFSDYKKTWERLSEGETHFIIFMNHGGSKWSKFWAVVETTVDARTGRPGNPIADISAEERRRFDEILDRRDAVNEAKRSVEKTGERYDVTSGGANP